MIFGFAGFLAVVDASTLGEFRMYAIPWQMSAGCQLAGFLGVLSSELSVYTLAVITMERNYAITHAMHLNKRLSLKHASYIMAIGWIFALTMAILPLTGVSDYRKFAVCLPFETDGAGLGYIVFLMFINALAFVILMGCYLKIYCAIRGSQAWNSNDSRIAKRMALLVFTDFLCWAPIAFFSLSAAFGLQLLSLEDAKIFTIFILPLNSCCNPFLYALLTKQFKKDCVQLCKTIEESRVTRGIGRCRHSSNFSNRQTPANTNSALDQNSRSENPSCSCGSYEKKRSKIHNFLHYLRHLCCYRDMDELTSAGDTSTQPSGTPTKAQRVTSLSSDTGSNSWTGMWRRGQAGASLRLLDLRRQATLDLTRKSSQESSLSSRNDSSATSSSTVTWRVSRSSVSSDTSSGGVKGTRNEALGRTGSLREPKSDDPLIPGSSGSRIPNIARHPNIIGVKGSFRGRPKPVLQRQRAVEVGGAARAANEGLMCPLHPIGDLSCVYEQDSSDGEDTPVFTVPSPNLAPHRSLSDGQLCRPPLHDEPTRPSCSIADKSLPGIPKGSPTPRPGLLETHFPMEDKDDEQKSFLSSD